MIAALVTMAGLVVTASAATATLTAEADAFVLSSRPDSNKGRMSSLRISGDVKVSYVRFDVPALLPGEAVVQAMLHVFANSGSKCSAGAQVLRAASDTWGERSITWNNQPGPTGSALASASWSSAGYQILDVTGAVAEGGPVSFVLRHPPGCSGAGDVSFNSREASANLPQLHVETSPAGNIAPTATGQSVSTQEDTALAITLSGSDAETCELTFSIVSPPATGSLGPLAGAVCAPGSPNSDSGSVTYTPAPGFAGDDSFTFKVNDGASDSSTAIVSITVIPSTDPPPDDRIRIEYLPSDEDFANPERGFMKQSSIFVDQPLDPFKIRALQVSDSLVWVYFRLDNYRDPRDGYGVALADYQGRLIDQVGLDTIRSTFATARSKGLKLVIRFVYNPGPGSTTDPALANPDVPIELALQHIAQLMPLLIENADVIAVMQAGFVGHWGEWHSSKYLHEHRKVITDALLDALPRHRMLQIRYPRYKEIFYQGPLAATGAFSGTDASRVGHHNDSFLRGTDDAGTYRSRTSQPPQYESSYCSGVPDEIACWKGFVAQEGRFTPVGGETSQYNPPRTDCPNAVVELEMLHFSFLNNGYNKEVLNGWTSGGCMPEIRRRLGYRFVLKEAVVPRVVPRGGTLAVDVILRNEGFASPFDERPVYVVVENGIDRYEFRLSVDPRRWEPGLDQTIRGEMQLPSTIATGTYSLSLWLPDDATSLRGFPAYAIRFANPDTWNAALGLNLLTSDLRIE